jgi:hypothetical protein
MTGLLVGTFWGTFWTLYPVLAAVVVLFLLFYFSPRLITIYAQATEVEPIVAEASKRIEEELASGSRDRLENLRVALETVQVNQLTQYHATSLAQSRFSFWFSIIAAALGFVVILAGASALLFGGDLNSAILGVVSGTIIDAVAALFFRQSNEARRLMTDFFDKLRLDRQFNESLRLCEAIPDLEMQSRIKAQMCLFFAGLPSTAATQLGQNEIKTAHQEARQ